MKTFSPRSLVFSTLALAFVLGTGPAVAAEAPPPAAPATAPSTPFGIPNAVEVVPGLISAGQPTEEQLRQAAAAGYRSVIDLRPPAEDHGFDEPAIAAGLGLRYVNVPVTLDTLDAATVERFREVFAKAEQPVLLHCASANRTGALYYAHLVLDQKIEPEEALKRARAAGLKAPPLEEKVKAVVAEAAKP